MATDPLDETAESDGFALPREEVSFRDDAFSTAVKCLKDDGVLPADAWVRQLDLRVIEDDAVKVTYVEYDRLDESGDPGTYAEDFGPK